MVWGHTDTETTWSMAILTLVINLVILNLGDNDTTKYLTDEELADAFDLQEYPLSICYIYKHFTLVMWIVAME